MPMEEVTREELYAGGRDRRQKKIDEAKSQRERAFFDRKDPQEVIREQLARQVVAAPAPQPQPQEEYQPPQRQYVEQRAQAPAEALRLAPEPKPQPPVYRQPQYAQPPAPRHEPTRSDVDVSLTQILEASGMNEQEFKKELILYLIDYLHHEQKSLTTRIQDLEGLLR